MASDPKTPNAATPPAKPPIPVPENRIYLAENLDLNSPALAQGVTQDTFEVLANWISDLIGVRISKDTLQTLLGSIPVVGSVFSAFDIVADIKILASYRQDVRKWGYETFPPWVDTGLDVIGILPLPPFKQASMGLKSLIKMAIDPKFVMEASKQAVAGMAIAQATELLEDIANKYMPSWETDIRNGFRKTVDGTISTVDVVARQPGARAISSVYTFVSSKKDPAEEIKDLLLGVRKTGDLRIKEILHGGEQQGFIPLILEFAKKHKSAHSSATSKPVPASARRHENEQPGGKKRNAAPDQENNHELNQGNSVTTKARANGPQNPTAAPGCKSCTTPHPINLATGEEVLNHTDFAAPGRMPVDFTRTYRSSNAACDDGPLGARWSSAYTTFLRQSADKLTYHDAEGRAVRLPRLVIGERHDHSFEAFTVHRESASVITLTYRNGDVDHFRADAPEADGSLCFRLCTQTRLNGPALHILTPDEARARFKDRPPAAQLSPEALLILTDGHSLWLECHPADQESFARESLAAQRALGPSDPLVQADQRAGIAYIAPEADPRLAPGAWINALARKIGRIDQLLSDGTRHTHTRYTYAPALDAQGAPLPGRLELVGQYDAEGRGRHYAYTQLPARDDAPGDCHLLACYSDAVDFGLGFTQRLEWESHAAWAPFPVRCIRTVAQDGSEDTRLAYDTWHNETTLTDALGQTSVFSYNADNLVTGIATPRPDGSVPYKQRIWDRAGNLTREIDPEGRVTRMNYDEQGNLLSVTDPAGNTTRYTYDAGNRPLTITDPAGGVWQRRYDERGNLLGETDPAGRSSSTTWDANGLPLAHTDAGGGQTRFNWNDSGQLIARTDCSGKTTRLSYDRLGRLQAETDPLGRCTRFETDRGGRVTAQVFPDGARETYQYTPAGLLAAITDPNGAITRYAYNGQGLLTGRIDPLGRTLAYHYNAALQLTTLVNENGESCTFAYDTQGHLSRETGFDGLSTDYTYDRAGRLIESTHGLPTRRTRTLYERDPLGRLLKKTVSLTGRPRQDVSAYRYDPLGRLIAAENRHARLSYTYNAAGGLIEETQQHIRKGGAHCYTLRHELDALGNRIATVLPHGRRIDTQRYGSGHWIGTLWNGLPLVDLERDGLHRETLRQIGTRPEARLTRTRDYDARARLARQRLTGANQAILAQRTHSWDPAGHLTRLDDPTRGRTDYAYDPAGQLLRATRADLDEQFAWDPAGNLLDSAPERRLLANTDARDHAHWDEGLAHLKELPAPEPAQRPRLALVTRNLLKQYQGTLYEHDSDGNTIRKVKKGKPGEAAVSLSLHYDPDNRLVKAIRPQGKGHLEAEYAYDPFGRRIAKSVRICVAQATGTHGRAADTFDSETHTAFVWDGDTLVQEIQAERSISYLYEPESFVPLAQVVSDVPASAYTQAAADALCQAREQRRAQAEQEAEALQWLELTDKAAAEQLRNAQAQRAAQEADAERQALEAQARTDRIYHLDTDHLGTPQEAYADDGKVVWLAHYRAWGRIQKLDKAEITQPFRFQGQYEDEETGLYYNRHRYYDPDSARYLTQDPIGLAGGNNGYAYTPNPTGWIDPLGLNACCTASRKGAFRSAKRDAKIPTQQQPDRVYNHRTGQMGQYNEVRMTDGNGNSILNAQGQQIWTKEYHYTRADGSHVIIQDHSAGHKFHDIDCKGDQASHFNVRPIENPRTGTVEGTKAHYPFRK